ncbi:MAG: hypothetical protein HY720_20780 [Planctomycetes bacterium]|nr:hypothetical protein [Planctomycetota bacterium]
MRLHSRFGLLPVVLALAGCGPTETAPPTSEPPSEPAPAEAALTEPAPTPAEPAADPVAQKRLEEEVARIRIENEKRDVVARHFYEAAERFYRETKYAEARDALRSALSLEPGPEIREKAARLLLEIEGILGVRG